MISLHRIAVWKEVGSSYMMIESTRLKVVGVQALDVYSVRSPEMEKTKRKCCPDFGPHPPRPSGSFLGRGDRVAEFCALAAVVRKGGFW